MTTKLTIEASIDQYTNAWNQTDPASIKAALHHCWTDRSSYIDPQSSLTIGPEALAELIYSSYEPMPGRSFRLLSQIDYHNGSGRFRWELSQPNHEVLEGMDFFEYNEENQVTRIVGFFGPLT
jgi:hypothetical protein